jgi:hypothetical protein
MANNYNNNTIRHSANENGSSNNHSGLPPSTNAAPDTTVATPLDSRDWDVDSATGVAAPHATPPPPPAYTATIVAAYSLQMPLPLPSLSPPAYTHDSDVPPSYTPAVPISLAERLSAFPFLARARMAESGGRDADIEFAALSRRRRHDLEQDLGAHADLPLFIPLGQGRNFSWRRTVLLMLGLGLLVAVILVGFIFGGEGEE